MTDARRLELGERLRDVRSRISAACSSAGRPAEEVRLIVVTKTFPASDVRLLWNLGVRDVGENRHPEARDKAEECRDLDLSWHFIGGLQSNKAAAVARYAAVLHSVDRTSLVAPLAKSASRADRDLSCLVQVSLDGPDAAPGRAGVLEQDLERLTDAVAGAAGLTLQGVMAVAPLGAPAEPAYERLSRLAQQVVARHPGATWVSAGMSGDLEAAVSHGATHVRVGSAVLGARPPLR